MKAINVAIQLYKSIGGTAFNQALAAELGWQVDRKPKAVNKPAGSKLARQLDRGTKGLTCRAGVAINRDV